MARIKHIAIRTPYPEKTAAFYKDVFGLKEVGQARAGVYLSDGYINLAILKSRAEDTGESPRDAAGYTGIHHLGFMVDDIGSCPLGPHVQESRRCSASRSSRRTPSSRGWSRRRRSSPMEQAPDGVLHGEERRRLDRRLPRGARAQSQSLRRRSRPSASAVWRSARSAKPPICSGARSLSIRTSRAAARIWERRERLVKWN